MGYQIATSFGLCYVVKACGGKGRELGRGVWWCGGIGLFSFAYFDRGNLLYHIWVMYFCIVIV
jgi:hypothetical protein